MMASSLGRFRSSITDECSERRFAPIANNLLGGRVGAEYVEFNGENIRATPPHGSTWT